jgi:hypothetical protein
MRMDNGGAMSHSWNQHSRRYGRFGDALRIGLVAAGVLYAILRALRRRNTHRGERAHWLRQNLRRAIIGNDKGAIRKVFGDPLSSSGHHSFQLADFMNATVWYYALDVAEQRALAIEFEDGVATDAKFIEVGEIASL